MSNRLLPPATKALLDAANYIEKNGHCRGQFFTYGETVNAPLKACVMGAIQLVQKDMTVQTDAIALLSEYLRTWRIGAWNDDPDRTAEEVVHALRQAAIGELNGNKQTRHSR